MTPAAWPRGPRDPFRPPRNRIGPSVRGRGRLAWGPRYPRPGEAAGAGEEVAGTVTREEMTLGPRRRPKKQTSVPGTFSSGDQVSSLLFYSVGPWQLPLTLYRP